MAWKTPTAKNNIIDNCPWIIEYIVDKSLVTKLTIGSDRKIEFMCPICKTKKTSVFGSVVRQGFSCPVCSQTIPFGERVMFVILNLLDVEFEKRKKFKWGVFEYDFYIPSLNMIIETHGEQHYRENTMFKLSSGKTQKETDIQKREVAKNNGILIYLEIPSDSRNKINIIELFIKYLSNYFNTSNLNSLEIINIAEINLKHKCLEMVESGYSYEDIKNELSISKCTISRYMKSFYEIGATKRNGNKKKVYQYDLCLNLISTYESCHEADRATGISYKLISSVCCGKRKTTHNYIWSYNEIEK